MKRPRWATCACKDCDEPSLVQKAGGKEFCEDCISLGCPDSYECLAKHLARDDDMRPGNPEP